MSDLVGVKIRLARKPMCHNGMCIIAMANEPYAGELICAGCGKHRAWMSHKLADFIKEAQRCFGTLDSITIGTPQERRELNNRDYEFDGVRVEIGNPAFPPRLYLKSRLYGSDKPVFGALPIPKGWEKLSTMKTQATVIAVGKAYREIADAIAFLSERYGKHNVHVILKRQEAPAIKRLDEDGNEIETQSQSAIEQEVHMRASDMFPSKYLKSSDVKDRPLTATISHLTQELVGQGKDPEKKPILHFKDAPSRQDALRRFPQHRIKWAAKPMVLNKTNAITLDTAWGDTENWAGRKVRIGCVETTYGGRAIDGIRVKPLGAAAAAKPVVDPELNDEVTL